MRYVTRFLACASLCSLSLCALADPVTYTFSGTGTGTAGTLSFTDALFTLVVSTDTSLITTTSSGAYITPYTSPTIDIMVQGIGSGTVTGIRVFDYNPSNLLGLQALPSGNDILDLSDPSFGTYNLSTSLGPIGPSDPSSASVSQFQNIPSTLGPLTFTTIIQTTFTADVSSAGIPESSTFVLMGSIGVIGAGFLRRRRTR